MDGEEFTSMSQIFILESLEVAISNFQLRTFEPRNFPHVDNFVLPKQKILERQLLFGTKTSDFLKHHVC